MMEQSIRLLIRGDGYYKNSRAPININNRAKAICAIIFINCYSQLIHRTMKNERVDSEAYRKFIMKDKRANWVGIENGTVKGTYS